MKLAKNSWLIAAIAAIVLSTQAVASQAHAQVPAATQVDTMGKGTIGLGLVGAELGFVIPALAGMDDTWAYVVFPTVGAAGGALAGYFLIDQSGTHQEIGVATLAAGMALVIPAMVLTLSETAYDPANDLDDQSTIDGEEPEAAAAEDYEVGGSGDEATAAPPADEPSNTATPDPAPAPAPAPEAAPAPAPAPAPGARLHHPRSRRPMAAVGTGLLRVNERGWYLGMPSVTSVPAYSFEEMRRLGLSAREQHAEVHVQLFSATF